VHVGHSANARGCITAAERKDMALPSIGCCMHGAKPNRIRPAVISSGPPRTLVREQPRDDHQHDERDENQRDVRSRHRRYPGASSSWRARRIRWMPLPRSPSSNTAVK
jgi:hypothetical protein